MGGTDKPLMLWQDRPMVAYVVDLLRPLLAHVCISANRNQSQYAAYGPVVTDSTRDYQGPLGGVLAAMRYSQEAREAEDGKSVLRRPIEHVLVCAGDAPTLPSSAVRALLENAGDRPVFFEYQGRAEPLPVIVPMGALGSLQDYLGNGGRRVIDWLSMEGAHNLAWPAATPPVNVNSRSDLARLPEPVGPKTGA